MNIQKPLFWHQGLFLQPQHLQLLDRSFQSLIVPYNDFIQPHFWGVDGIEIQEASLGIGSLNILRGNFLFPDGTFAAIPGNALMEARTFDESWVEGGKPLKVYVGLRKWNDNGGNVTVLEKLESVSEVPTRFVTVADAEEVRDLHTKGPLGQVKSLNYVLKIVWETELDKYGDYELIPITRLEKSAEAIINSDNFSPPSLTISSSEQLFRIIKDIRDQVTSRSHQLEEYKSQKGIQTAEFGTRDMVYLLALRSLNRYVPILIHLTETKQVHPWAVYGIIKQLIGELSTFSDKINVIGESNESGALVPGYDHNNLWECFSAGRSLISQLLDEITAGPEYVIRLMYDGTYYASDLKPAVFEGRNRFYLACRTSEEHKAMIQSLASLAKLSAREHLPILIARALPGIELEPFSIPPQELPKRADTIYFAIDHHNDQWKHIAKGNNIALYWDNAPEDLEVELMIVSKQ